MTHTILIADDDATQRNILQHVITEKLGYRSVMAKSAEEVLEYFLKSKKPLPDLILLDFELGDKDGLYVMQSLRDNGIDIPVIIVTGYGDMEKSNASIRAGAHDFLSKPVNVDRLSVSLRNALHARQLLEQVLRLEKNKNSGVSFNDIIGTNTLFRSAITQAMKLATASAHILIEGEGGVGKEMLARAIHSASSRSKHPFVVVNCSALSDDIADQVLFGSEKTGSGGTARSALSGRFFEAHQGTLFLENVSDLRLEIQAKLLRAIQEREIVPVGATEPMKIDVRILSSTSRNIEHLVQRGEFRGDLFYRIGNSNIVLPALRERREDIQLLVAHFLKKHAAREHRPVQDISPSALGMLVSQSWLGNIRQLESVILRAVVLSNKSHLDIDDFEQLRKAGFGIKSSGVGNSILMGHNHPETSVFDSRVMDETSSLLSLVGSSGHTKRMDQIEVETIRYALHYYKGHMSEVARRLGIGRSTLYRKMHDFNIAQPDLAGAE